MKKFLMTAVAAAALTTGANGAMAACDDGEIVKIGRAHV